MPRYRAPGRVNLIGEHTDYSGGLVLPAAIDRVIDLDVTDVGGELVRLTSSVVPGEVEVRADGSADGPDWARYPAGVRSELAELGIDVPGFTGSLTSDLPTGGTGLSSSAALEMVLGTAMLDLADATLEPVELARLGQRAEHRATGVPTGIMDQAAIVLGVADHAVRIDTGTLDHRLVPLPDDLAIVVVDSGVRRQLEDSGYAQRRAELESSIEALGGRAIRDLEPDDLPAIEPDLDDVAFRRLRHVVTDNARVREVTELLTSHGVTREERKDGLGELLAAGHASMRDDFEASHPALDLLVECAVARGAVAARMTGGGFGGAIVTLVERERVDGFVAALLDDARDAGLDGVEAHPCVAADGARRLA